LWVGLARCGGGRGEGVGVGEFIFIFSVVRSASVEGKSGVGRATKRRIYSRQKQRTRGSATLRCVIRRVEGRQDVRAKTIELECFFVFSRL
jgi:hypothetical protein